VAARGSCIDQYVRTGPLRGCGGSDNDCLPNEWTCADECYGDGVCDENDEDC